ncbi:MAG: gamma-butyrobetaine hydroxylase-like domain-containing protein [Pseudomonadota bacterium]
MSPSGQEETWPEELRYDSASTTLEITLRSGAKRSVSAKTLRENSPSAEVQGHGAGPRRSITVDYPVTITRMVPVGRYAVRLVFDDGHDSGLYTWPYLSELSDTAAT